MLVRSSERVISDSSPVRIYNDADLVRDPVQDASPIDPSSNNPAVSNKTVSNKRTFAICSTCQREILLRKDGLIRIHGPVAARCPGSEQLPTTVPSSDVSPTPSCMSPSGDNTYLSVSRPVAVKVIKKIPRGCREKAARKFAEVLEDTISSNSIHSWSWLLYLPGRCLRVPKRGGRRWNLTSLINRQIAEERDPPRTSLSGDSGDHSRINSLQAISRRISTKLEEGDYKGAIRLACSQDTFAVPNTETMEALKSKHPPPHPASSSPTPPDGVEALEVSHDIVMRALLSFPKGSAGGPDLLRPQHLVDMTSPSAGEGGIHLKQALTSFTNFVLAGKVNHEIRPILFGANILALKKNDGGIRPIAIGSTLRRLVAKVGCMSAISQVKDYLSPRQLGFGTKLGAEAAIHSARIFLNEIPSNYVLVKLDFQNAFNSIRRDKVLEATLEHMPDLYPLVHCCYSSCTHLFYEEVTLLSREGVQQGDPLGPLLFCLAIHPLIEKLRSDLRIFYLDDGLIGGHAFDVSNDISLIQEEASHLGLCLNLKKSELIAINPLESQVLLSAPDLIPVLPNHASFLGAPIGSLESIDSAISSKCDALKIMGDRLPHFRRHDSLVLLRNAFSIPKIQYLLRTSPCYRSHKLAEFDLLLRSITSTILNINLSDDNVWLQASLPIWSGGIGVRSAVHLAPSAFLASAAGCLALTKNILPPRLHNVHPTENIEALALWKSSTTTPPPSDPSSSQQKEWDRPQVLSRFDSLLRKAHDPISRARLLGSASKESGAWLNAPPVSSLGLRMDDETITISVGLRLGVALCCPLLCRQCGLPVDKLALHGLSCLRSQGHHPRHNAINDIIGRSLSAAGVPCQTEPKGLS